MHKNENTQNSLRFLALAFLRGIYLSRYQRIWNQHKILRFLDTHTDIKKKKFWGSIALFAILKCKWEKNSTFSTILQKVKSYFLPISIILRVIPIKFETLKPPRAHPLAREEVGESQFQRGDIHCGTLQIYVLCDFDEGILLKMPVRWSRHCTNWSYPSKHTALLQYIPHTERRQTMSRDRKICWWMKQLKQRRHQRVDFFKLIHPTELYDVDDLILSDL